MSLRKWFAATLAATGSVVSTSGFAPAADPTPTNVRAVIEFKSLRASSSDTAKAKVEAWLRSVGTYDAKSFESAWLKGRSVEECTVKAIAAGMPEVDSVLDAARKGVPAPDSFPATLKDDKLDPFVRANVSAAYAKMLIGKRAYEDALEAMAGVKTDELVDPAGFYFHKAVAEHATIRRVDAIASLTRLLDDVSAVPDRYVTVATLMYFDLQSWSGDEKNLLNIGRLMDNSSRRLDLARADEQTKQIQKKIVYRLDEIIKQMENRERPRPPREPEEPRLPMPPLPNPMPGPGDIPMPPTHPGERPIPGPRIPGPSMPGDENCPPGGVIPGVEPHGPRAPLPPMPPGPGEPEPGDPGMNPPVDPTAKDPATKSYVAGPGGKKGDVNEALLRHYRDTWGSLPADKRAEVMSQYQRETPAKFRPMIEAYFKSLNRMHGY